MDCQIGFNTNFICISFGSLDINISKMWNQKLWPRDCHTAEDRKFGCTSLGIPDTDILPYSSLSKSRITKTVSCNYCLGTTKSALIEVFVVYLLEA